MCNPTARSPHKQAASSPDSTASTTPTASRASSSPTSRMALSSPASTSTSVVPASGTSSSSSSPSSSAADDPSVQRKLRKRPVSASAHQRRESRDEEFLPLGAIAASGEGADAPPQRSRVPSPLLHEAQHQHPNQRQRQHGRYEEGDEEDEIPGLVDEDAGNYGYETNLQHRTAQSWPRRHSEPYHRESDLEVDVGARPSTPPPTLPSLGRTNGSANANASADSNGHPNTHQPQPFFVLDWMLDELVPEDRTAQDLAELLRETSAPAPAPASPMVQHLLPWLWNRTETNTVETADSSSRSPNQPVGRVFGAMTLPAFETPTEGQGRPASPAVNASSNESYSSPCTSPSFRSPGANAAVIDPSLVPPLPSTPKSSNRRACRIRHHLEPRRAEESSRDPGFRSEFLVPVNLDQKFREEEHPAADSIAFSPPAQRRILFPSSAPPSPSPMWGGEGECDGIIGRNEQAPPPTRGNGSGSSSSSNHVSPTGRSNSCPQLFDETTRDPEEQLRKQQQQRRRRQQQINRRERRNKLTIVQRSLTLAKGWNTKGLDMAGRATRAEDERARALEEMGIGRGRDGSPEQLWESALECWDNALEVYRSLLGPSHERVADVQNNRGIALGKLRRYGEAREALGMVLDARKAQQRKRAAKEASTPGDGRGTGNSNNGNSNNNHHRQSPRHSNEAAASASAEIVSTLHNIANVHRCAGEPSLALEALLEAQELLRSINDEASSLSVECPEETHNRWLQLARLSTAIGHVCYESECWRDARDAYMEALQVYQQLSQEMTEGSGDIEDRERMQQLWESMSCEVSALEDYLDELDRRQQAEAGSRTLLLRARREEQQRQQQQQQQRWPRSPHRQRTSPRSSGQEQSSSTTKMLLGFVTHMRA